MIAVIFTLDYEIYGNGTGSLEELVYKPGEQLAATFRRHDSRFVTFVEAAEFEQIEAHRTDSAVTRVKDQVRQFHDEGFEVALHLHPQWYKGRFEHGQWRLEYEEYNLCTLPGERIAEIVDRAIAYLRSVTADPGFVPLSFRAGNWLFQPSAVAAEVLCSRGLKIDSSVFKGGRQHQHGLDYRRALRNGDFWRFSTDVNEPDAAGPWLEIPVYAEMVPFWRMFTGKRVRLQSSGASAGVSTISRLRRLRDYARPMYPLKLDFCRMTFDEMTAMTRRLIASDRTPNRLTPVVAIGHTKDLVDIGAVDAFLKFLRANNIDICTFRDVYPRLSYELPEAQAPAVASLAS